MKIEVNCAHCQSILRVAAEHAGKQLRCPTCGNLSQIPADPTADRFKQPLDDYEEPQPAYINATYEVQPSQGTEALIFGILGIVFNFGCGCLFPLWFVMNLFGLYLSIKTNGSYRTAAIVTNSIALAIAGFWLLIALFAG